MTRVSFFYVEMWPPGQYSTEVTFLRVDCRKMTPLNNAPGVSILCRNLTHGQYYTGVTFLNDTVELMVWFSFLQEKNDPLAVEYWPGGGHIST
jgi:hypothetical protein